MKTFIKDDFLLHSKTAQKLYRKYAERMPIFDYHCHLNPKQILEDRQFKNLTEVWLLEDHYKWRLMRANGIEEPYITGNADPYEKFLKWADTVSRCMGNPLYHWTHLELKRVFDIDEILTPKTAPEIWKACSVKLAQKEFSVRNLIKRFNVKALCTTDDPVDDLASHKELAGDPTVGVKVLPTFRPEKAMSIENDGFTDYIVKLSRVSGIPIRSFEDVIAALMNRAEYFKEAGCLISDHSFGSPDFTKGTLDEARNAFRKAMAGETPSSSEVDAYKLQILLALGRIYHSLGFAMQLHVGVIRNSNTRMFRITGPDAGFDSIGDGISAHSLSALLNGLDTTDELPKTIVYSLYELDDTKIASVMGCFQGGGVAGKLQLGSAWWFSDHIDGMRYQMKTLANIGILGSFIGMLTDSRSFLSYTRHEYFRRILCDLIGGWAESGEVPDDDELLGKMVEDICFHNAVNYLNLKL